MFPSNFITLQEFSDARTSLEWNNDIAIPMRDDSFDINAYMIAYNKGRKKNKNVNRPTDDSTSSALQDAVADSVDNASATLADDSIANNVDVQAGDVGLHDILDDDTVQLLEEELLSDDEHTLVS